MIQFSFLDKSKKEEWLLPLFDLFYRNMSEIAPGRPSQEEERAWWFSEISPALDKAPRQVILCTEAEELLGYLQYYTRDDLLMIEEVQVAPSYRGTLLFYRMCRFLEENIPSEIRYIEAYARKKNTYSKEMMQKLGMIWVEEGEGAELLHFRGDADAIRKRFVSGKPSLKK